jgi:peptide/nickel transport system ATP-binding protein
MYLGEIVEQGPATAVFGEPRHPAPPPGCRFHARCPVAFDRCPVERPALRPVAPGHRVACHLY